MHSITLNIEETTMRGFKTFGEWHQARRRALDFTQKELAQQVNCAEISIRKIESNELRPSRALLEMLMNALRVPPEERAEMIAWARRR